MEKVNLEAPWLSFAKKIKYTYGLGEHITVNDLIKNGDGYTLTISVRDDSVAAALEVVLPKTQNFGGVVIAIVIFNSTGNIVPETRTDYEYTPETLANIFKIALSSNPLFIGSVLTEGKLSEITLGNIGDVVIIIKREIVLFSNDDISDLCGNFTEVAAKVFQEFTQLTYLPKVKISFSTHDEKCELQKAIYAPTDKK